MDFGSKNFVLAVFGPGLGQHFQFGVERISGQMQSGPRFAYGRIGKMTLDSPHFGQAERQGTFTAERCEGGVIHAGKRDDVHNVVGRASHFCGAGFKRMRGQLFTGADFKPLDEFVGQEPPGNALHILSGQIRRFQAVLHRGIDRQLFARRAVLDTQHQGSRVSGSAAFVVGDTGPEPHFNDPVCGAGQRSKRRLLQDRIVERVTFKKALRLLRRETAQGKHLDLADSPDGKAECLPDAHGRLAARGVVNMGKNAGFQSMEHMGFSFSDKSWATGNGLPPLR